MKALSYIVASIIMLIITVALSGTAWLYISGFFTSGMQGIDIADSFCSLGEVTLSIKNIGTSPITRLDTEQTYPKDDLLVKQFQGTIEPGKTVQYTDTCEGEQSRRCIYRITPPQGRAITSEADCEGKPASLVLSLHFDEGFGTTAKDSGMDNNGIFYGEIFNDGELMPTDSGPTRVEGKYGKALQFDGSNGYVDIPDSASLSMTTEVTVMAWVKPISTGIDHSIHGNKFNYGDLKGYRFNLWSDGKVDFRVGNGTHAYDAKGGDWVSFINKWIHVAGTFDGNTIRVYMNGSEVGWANLQGPIFYFGSDIRIGDGGWEDKFNGTIDEVRIFNRSLTQSEIQAEMQSSIPITRPVASYSFEETGNYANDTHIWVKGKYGNALSFDGSNDYVNISNSSSLSLTTDGTIEFWAKLNVIPTSGTQDQQFIVNGKVNWAATNGYVVRLSYEDANTINFLFNAQGNSYLLYNIKSLIDTTNFHHYVVTWSGGTAKLYFDGIEKTSGSIVSLTGTNNYTTIGYWSGENKYFNGTIDEARIYGRAII